MRKLPFESALVLDNFAKILTTGERILVNQYRGGRTDYVPPKAEALQEYIDKEGWETPQIRYNDFRELQWLGIDKVWRPLNEYKDFNIQKIRAYVSRKLGTR